MGTFSPIIKAVLLLLLSLPTNSLMIGGQQSRFLSLSENEKPLQDKVTWDEHSLLVDGERVLFYGGEFHPFRLPVPGLWLDVFQKIRAMGYNGVSAYFDWALLEGNPGHFTADGVFALEPFFEAASKAGIYILARPGPYINAEVSGGGFPGWMARLDGQLRSTGPFLNATENYVKNICNLIGKAEITKGGPVILVQVENEYSYDEKKGDPSPGYFSDVIKQFRDAGITVPLINNNVGPQGNNAPGTPEPVDIYGHDGYPLGFDCSNPQRWSDSSLPTNWRTLHNEQSPNTPYSIIEFQGGSYDPWGGPGFESCTMLLGPEFQRVFYKNDFSFGVTIFNLYMTYGGTNWGNLGHPGGYTSYDYGAVIKENREVTREKYSDAKLMANFLMASPGYLEATPGTPYPDSGNALVITPLATNSSNPYNQQFFVVRRDNVSKVDSVDYHLDITTSNGSATVPQLGGQLTLNGRDSKIHVADYPVGAFHLLYSTAEIFTWKKDQHKTVLIVYGAEDETHELAFVNLPSSGTLSIPGEVKSRQDKGSVIINWKNSPDTRVVELPGNLFIYIIDRNSAYNYWVLNLPSDSPKPTDNALIVKGGYLMRTGSISRNEIALTGDINSTTPIEIIAGAPGPCFRRKTKLKFNGKDLNFNQDSQGVISAEIEYVAPQIDLPNLTALTWHYIDTLPELDSHYSDEAWVAGDHPATNNTWRHLTTPTSLYSQDYGFHTGTLVYRGHFNATGEETKIAITAQGGLAFGFSAWLGANFIGSYTGSPSKDWLNQTFSLPPGLLNGHEYTLTVVIDNMGLNEDIGGTDRMKTPRGIPDFELFGHAQSDVKWKLTGNLGGETYLDQVRGPLNEGGLWAERQGFHLPNPPVHDWEEVTGGPMKGISQAGIGFYVSNFDLDLPKGYDIPLAFAFANNSSSRQNPSNYRAQFYINGWQFGKYVNNIGPQTSFPVPEGILNYRGTNWIAISLWALDDEGAKLDGLSMETGTVSQWDYDVDMVTSPGWEHRPHAY